jgi:pantoate--beta-alanine ligase
MSSRNVRLTDDERAVAIRLYKALVFLKQQVLQGVATSEAISIAKAQWLNHPKLKLEYLALVDADTMEQHELTRPEIHYAVVIACWCSNVRLIDNMLLTD